MVRLFEFGMCLALLALPAAQAGGKPKAKDKKPEPQKSAAPAALPPLQVFTGKLADARKLARERNAGLLIHVMIKDMDGENQEYRKRFLEEPALRAACERLIVLISDNGQHPSKSIEETVDGKKQTREACSVYPWFQSCAQHQLNLNDLALEYRDEDGSMHCPQTILQAPDGSVLVRLNSSGVGDPAEIEAGVAELEKKFGKGLLPAEWTELARALDEGRGAQASRTWPLALRRWTRVRELSPLSAYGTEAAKVLPEIERALATELEETCKGLVPGSAAAAWRRLSDLQTACSGLPFEKQVAARLKQAEAQKDIQAEIAVVKLEAEAEALLKTAQEQADAKKDKELEKTVRKLLGKRYAATPAAKSARTLWPEWAAEEERKAAK